MCRIAFTSHIIFNKCRGPSTIRSHSKVDNPCAFPSPLKRCSSKMGRSLHRTTDLYILSPNNDGECPRVGHCSFAGTISTYWPNTNVEPTHSLCVEKRYFTNVKSSHTPSSIYFCGSGRVSRISASGRNSQCTEI